MPSVGCNRQANHQSVKTLTNRAAAADTDEFDDYTLVARGLNASQGPFDPEAVDLLQITILPMED